MILPKLLNPLKNPGDAVCRSLGTVQTNPSQTGERFKHLGNVNSGIADILALFFTITRVAFDFIEQSGNGRIGLKALDRILLLHGLGQHFYSIEGLTKLHNRNSKTKRGNMLCAC